MNVKDCIFCKMVLGQIPVVKIYEDDAVLSFLDIGPLSDGHTLIIPKEHYTRIDDCPAELLGKVALQFAKISRAVKNATNADGYNVLCNNGRAAGQLVQHVHFHIIPRKSGDGVFNRWPAYKYPPGEIEKIADKIKKLL